MFKAFSDKVIVITGASSGIGRATALKCAQKGATLVLTSRREEALESLAQQCRDLGAQTLVVPADITNLKEVEEIVQKARAQFERIDVWVNNAAVSLFGRMEQVPYDAYRRVIETNLFGYVHGARAVIPVFREQGEGTLINVSSLIGRLGTPFIGAYTVSKFGIQGLSESLRRELTDAPDIHVCTVLPPSVDTPLFQHAGNYSGQAIKPLEPIHDAQEIANGIVSVIKHPRRELLIGMEAKQMAMMNTLAPALVDRLYPGMVSSNHFQHRPAQESKGNLFEPANDYQSVSGGWRETSGNGNGKTLGMALLGSAAVGIGLLVMARRHRPALQH